MKGSSAGNGSEHEGMTKVDFLAMEGMRLPELTYAVYVIMSLIALGQRGSRSLA